MKYLCGYMITWTVYGTWLQGNKRGYVKNGKTLLPNKNLENANKSSMKSTAFRLNKQQKDIVRQIIISEAEKNGQEILALSVCSNHIHLVAKPCKFEIHKLVRNYKSKSWHALKATGVKQKVWTKGYDKRFCFSIEKLKGKIEYVNNHN